MKHTVFYAIAALAMLSPAAVQAQRVQTIPDEVNEIRIEGHQNLHIVAGDENTLLVCRRDQEERLVKFASDVELAELTKVKKK